MDAELDGFTISIGSSAQVMDRKLCLPGKFVAQVFKGFLLWRLSAK